MSILKFQYSTNKVKILNLFLDEQNPPNFSKILEFNPEALEYVDMKDLQFNFIILFKPSPNRFFKFNLNNHYLLKYGNKSSFTLPSPIKTSKLESICFFSSVKKLTNPSIVNSMANDTTIKELKIVHNCQDQCTCEKIRDSINQSLDLAGLELLKKDHYKDINLYS
ncbi:hypothetical protein ACTFIU_010303 [Dictyostelium citrinum]